ncbi:MAG: hypothetical protein ACRBFS_21470 [Aureispira sp.]
MLERNKNSYQIQLKWKAYRKVYNDEDNTSQIVYQKDKPKEQTLKDFIIEESRKEAAIKLEYYIDGVNFGDWLNTHYFEHQAIGENYANNLSCFLSEETFKKQFFQYRKPDMKRLLGQLLTLEEALEFEKACWPKLSDKELLVRAEGFQATENMDTVLYCSACCGDRLCGYMGIKVYQTEEHIVWYFQGGKERYQFSFIKAQYFEAFEEYLTMLNAELVNMGIEPVSTTTSGEQRLDLPRQIEALKNKYELDAKELDTVLLTKILQKGDAEEMNAAIYWAQELGLDITSVEAFVEDTYKALTKEEQNALSWKMIDKEAYYNTLDLCHPGLVKKAMLLFGT